jgi:hypothetical protein
VSPVNSPLDPCRKSVKDPDLRDIRIGKDSEVIFSLRSIFNPIQTIENLELIGDLLGRIDATSSNGFKKYQDLDQKTFISLIRNWSGTQESKSLLRSISALYDKNLESWGLTGIPVTLFVKAPKVTEFNRDPFMESLNPIERGVNPSNVNLHLWREIALSGELNAPLEWPILKVGHVGDAQRGLKKSAGSEFLVGIIEPIRGIKTGTSESFGYGLGFTLFRPDGFEVRAISHK